MRKSLLGDLFGGFTAAIVALPLALAFGVQSGLGAVAGLYGAIILGIFAALLGGTKTQVSGPTGPMTVVATATVASEIAYFGSLELAIGPIIVTFFLAGIFQIIMGITKLGQYIKYIPYPVISGFMSGIGLIIITLQLFPLVGLSSPKTTLETLIHIGSAISHINLFSLFLAIGTIATIYLFPKLNKVIPSTLVALTCFTLLSIILKLPVPRIGDIPQGFPSIHLSAFIAESWHSPGIIIFTALTLACLGAIDSLLTSVVADNITHTQHNSNRELIGQGIGNALSGLFGGLPGAGATIRTIVNIKSGGSTRLSGITHGIILLIILLGAGKYAALIPLPVLAGILVTVGIGIIDYRSFRNIMDIPRADAIIMLCVMLLTVFVDLLQAVAVGMLMAALWFMKQMGDISENYSNGYILQDDNKTLFGDKKIFSNAKGKIYIQQFNGPIFFGFIFNFNKIIRELPEINTIIFRMEHVLYIDQSGLYAFEDAISFLKRKNINIIFSDLQKKPLSMFKKINVIPNLIPIENIHENFYGITITEKQ